MKPAIGDLTDDKDLERKGKADETGGKVTEFVEALLTKVEPAIDKGKHTLQPTRSRTSPAELLD